MTTAVSNVQASLKIIRPGAPVGIFIAGVELEGLGQDNINRLTEWAEQMGIAPTLRLLQLKDRVVPFLEVQRSRIEPVPTGEDDLTEEQETLWLKLIELVGNEKAVRCWRGLRDVEQAA